MPVRGLFAALIFVPRQPSPKPRNARPSWHGSKAPTNACSRSMATAKVAITRTPSAGAWPISSMWRGTENGVTRFLIFTEIPGTSGPNWSSLSDPKEIKAKFSWRTLDAAKSKTPSASTAVRSKANGSWPAKAARPSR